MSAVGAQFNAELRTNYRAWDLGTGLSYHNQQLSLGSGLRIRLYDSVPFVDLNGDTTYLPFNFRDSVLTKEAVDPSYMYASIPISVGRSVTLSPRASLSLHLQMQAKYLAQVQGTVNHPAISYTRLDPAGLNRFGLAAGLRTEFSYALLPYWQVRATASVNRDLFNVSRQTDLQQHFTLTGIGLGLYYRIK